MIIVIKNKKICDGYYIPMVSVLGLIGLTDINTAQKEIADHSVNIGLHQW